MDPEPVRPGTSDALFARTIDATIHPPLVRAQETVVALVPRVAQAAAPLASPLFLGALALTILFTWVAIRMRYRPVEPVEAVEPPDVDVQVEPVQVYLPPDFAERMPDWSREAMQSAERMMRENERVREIMQQIRYRIREEARRQRWRQM